MSLHEVHGQDWINKSSFILLLNKSMLANSLLISLIENFFEFEGKAYNNAVSPSSLLIVSVPSNSLITVSNKSLIICSPCPSFILSIIFF